MSFSPTVIISNPQKRVKDSYAVSPSVGLTVRANGEEVVQVITTQGLVVQAGIPNPTVAPTVADNGSGNLINGSYVGYIYAYAATTFYPFVDSTNAINGSLAPRSNQSPSVGYHITGSGNRQLQITVTGTSRADISQIWIFRTAYFSTLIEAQNAADAGAAFYIGQVANPGATTATYVDNAELTGIDQIELDNFVASTFQFVIFSDPYWWGFGNLPFVANASWTTGGLVTIETPDQWFTGRNGFNITLSGVTTGGIDLQGTFKFSWVSSTTAQLLLANGSTPTITAGTGTVTVQGPATTLYRSKPRNPFAWGYTTNIGSSVIPIEYTFQVGGGLGTALAVVPNTTLLKIDCEYPTFCYTLNLKLAGTDYFEQSLRVISTQYSVSSHFSQFPATTQTGFSVLWGMDYKNFAILQSNGVMQVPISGPIPRILRKLSTNRYSQISCHGTYDSRTELNCIWVTQQDALSIVNYLIYQHAPTGFWGFVQEFDLLASATIEDTTTGQNKTFVGTQTGLFGEAFVEGLFNNWLPNSGTVNGAISSATATTISIATNTFNTINDGIVGNWCLVTDDNNETEQWGRMSAITANTITFDLILPAFGPSTSAFNPIPVAGSLFYMGMIECKLRKDFDLDVPIMSKQLEQYWVTQENVDIPAFIRYYRDRELQYYGQFNINQVGYINNDGESDVWNNVINPTNPPSKSFALEIIQRGYSDWKFVNFVYKANATN